MPLALAFQGIRGDAAPKALLQALQSLQAIAGASASTPSPETMESVDLRGSSESIESPSEQTVTEPAHSPDLLLVAPKPLHLIRATATPEEQEQFVLREEAREAHRFARRKRGAEERSAREARSAEEESARVETLSSPFVSELAGEKGKTDSSLESVLSSPPEQDESG